MHSTSQQRVPLGSTTEDSQSTHAAVYALWNRNNDMPGAEEKTDATPSPRSTHTATVSDRWCIFLFFLLRLSELGYSRCGDIANEPNMFPDIRSAFGTEVSRVLPLNTWSTCSHSRKRIANGFGIREVVMKTALDLDTCSDENAFICACCTSEGQSFRPQRSWVLRMCYVLLRPARGREQFVDGSVDASSSNFIA